MSQMLELVSGLRRPLEAAFGREYDTRDLRYLNGLTY